MILPPNQIEMTLREEWRPGDPELLLPPSPSTRVSYHIGAMLCIVRPKKKQKRTAAKEPSDAKINAEAIAAQRSLSNFLCSLDDLLLRKIVRFWIGFSDEDDAYQRSLSTRDCVLRWVLAAEYAESVEKVAKTHFNYSNSKLKNSEQCLCDGCDDMPDCVDLRTRMTTNVDDDGIRRILSRNDDYFVRISYRGSGHQPPTASQVCQGFVTSNPIITSGNDVYNLSIDLALDGIYDEVVDKEWPQMEHLLGYDARNRRIPPYDDVLRKNLRTHVIAALKSLTVTVVAIERSAGHPWSCQLVVSSGGYRNHTTLGEMGGSLDVPYFQLRSLRSHGHPRNSPIVIPGLKLKDGILSYLTIAYNNRGGRYR